MFFPNFVLYEQKIMQLSKRCKKTIEQKGDNVVNDFAMILFTYVCTMYACTGGYQNNGNTFAFICFVEYLIQIVLELQVCKKYICPPVFY